MNRPDIPPEQNAIAHACQVLGVQLPRVEGVRYQEACATLEAWKAKELRDRHRELSKRLHPDMNQAADAKERFQEMQSAFEFIRDDVRIRPPAPPQPRPVMGRPGFWGPGGVVIVNTGTASSVTTGSVTMGNGGIVFNFRWG